MKKEAVFVILFVIISLIFFAYLTYAQEGESSSYEIDSTHSGVTGGEGESSSYEVEDSSTSTTSSGGEFESSALKGIIRWFKETLGIEITPEEEAAPSEEAGGGGITETFDELTELKTVPSSFDLRGTTGIDFFAKIYLKNTGNEQLNIDISVSSELEDIISFRENQTSLEAEEERILNFDISPPNEEGVYEGNLLFTSGNKRLEVPFKIKVSSERSLYDILININDTYKTIEKGEKLVSSIALIQTGVEKQEDVTLNYEITDENGEVVLKEVETRAVIDIERFKKTFNTQDFDTGDYSLSSEVIYSGGIAIAEGEFKIVEREFTTTTMGLIIYWIMISILLVSIIIVIIIIYRKIKARNKRKERISEY